MDSNPSRVSQARRTDIREFLETRNATTDQLARRFFPSETPESGRKKASRWLCRQRKRKRVRVRGVVLLNGTGRLSWEMAPALILSGVFQRLTWDLC